MALEVKRKGNEKYDVILRRFNRLVQWSGLFKTVKESKFYKKPKTRRERREEAKRKEMIKKIRLKKIYQ